MATPIIGSGGCGDRVHLVVYLFFCCVVCGAMGGEERGRMADGVG